MPARKRITQTLCLICLFAVSTIVTYLAVSWKLSMQWTPDIIDTRSLHNSYMIQPTHASNMSISIVPHSVLLKEAEEDDTTQNNNETETDDSNSDIIHQMSDDNLHESIVKISNKTHDEMHDLQMDLNTSSSVPIYHPEWNTINDSHLRVTNASYDESDFSFWWLGGDGAPLFINASKYDPNGTFGYDSFVFCPIPKVGCSSWKQVMRRIKGIDAYLADDYWSLHHEKENGLEMDRIYRNPNGSGVNADAANHVLHYIDRLNHNKSIFHAAFIRDALERSLSAFLDKCVQSEWHKRYWCQPQTVRKIGRYSHFDVFVEAAISKAIKPKHVYLQRYSFWKLDYHWLPQNWICDLYKFIHRYHIYNADQIMDRKHFFLNIGGTKAWDAIGATGWFHHNKRRRLIKENLFVIPEYKKWEYVDTVNHVRREHGPKYRGYRAGNVLDISGSLLSENAAHAQDTRRKVYSYYRADLLGKAIVYYLDDYVLFDRQLPQWICAFVHVEGVLERVMEVNSIYADHTHTMDKEKAILFDSPHNPLTLGKTSIWNELTSGEEKANVTARTIQLTDKQRENTKLKCFYDVLLPADVQYHTLFAVLRGTSFLLDVLLNVDEKVLPIHRDDLVEKKKILMRVLHLYLNEYIPYRLRLHDDDDTFGEAHWLDIMKCLHLELDANGAMDVNQLSQQWDNENDDIIEQVRYNMLYNRDVPRNAKFGNAIEKKYLFGEPKVKLNKAVTH
eukprot:219611_1